MAEEEIQAIKEFKAPMEKVAKASEAIARSEHSDKKLREKGLKETQEIAYEVLRNHKEGENFKSPKDVPSELVPKGVELYLQDNDYAAANALGKKGNLESILASAPQENLLGLAPQEEVVKAAGSGFKTLMEEYAEIKEAQAQAQITEKIVSKYISEKDKLASLPKEERDGIVNAVAEIKSKEAGEKAAAEGGSRGYVGLREEIARIAALAGGLTKQDLEKGAKKFVGYQETRLKKFMQRNGTTIVEGTRKGLETLVRNKDNKKAQLGRGLVYAALTQAPKEISAKDIDAIAKARATSAKDTYSVQEEASSDNVVEFPEGEDTYEAPKSDSLPEYSGAAA